MSQQTVGKQPLANVLAQLEERYGYQFNYAEETVAAVVLDLPAQTLTFLQALDYLHTETGLVFTVLDDGFVAVKTSGELTICGHLKTRESRMPIESAVVRSATDYVLTDSDGFFRLTFQDRQETITIQHMGYKTITKQVADFDPNRCAELYLQARLQSLTEVVISDYIVAGINKLNTGTYEIDFSGFEILPGLIEADVLQSLQAFPGIKSENETVSNINIRGGSHDQNLILWDDIKMYQSGHFFGLISMFNPQITEKVSLLKNGTDVSYTDGISGTIAMNTEADINPKFKGNIGLNFIDANVFVDVPIGKRSSVQIAARKAISDVAQTPTYRRFFDRISQNTEVEHNATDIVNSDKAFDFYDTSLRWLYRPSPKDEIRLNFINAADELVFDENAVVNGIAESRQSKVTQNSIAAGLQYKRTWSDQWQSIVSVYETDYKLKATNANIMDAQRFRQENKVSETGLKLNVYYRIDQRFQFMGGHQFVETEIGNLDDVDHPLFHSLVSEVVRTYATYSQLFFVSTDRSTNASFGGRLNYIEKFKKIILEPRFSFNQRFYEHFTFEVLGEFKHQNTSQVINFQNDFLGIEKRRWQLSNDDDIPILQSKQISAGVAYNHRGWLLSAEGYFKTVDGITSQSQGFQNQYEFVRTQGSYDVKGMDVLARKRMGDFSTWLSYSYMKNRYTFKAFQESSFPSNYDIEHFVTLGLTYHNDNLKIATGLNWHSGKPTTKPIEDQEVTENEINFGPANRNRLDEYLRVDFSALYDCNCFKTLNATFGVSVWNVLDNKNTINTTYRAVDGNSQEIEQNSLGLTPNFVLRVFF